MKKYYANSTICEKVIEINHIEKYSSEQLTGKLKGQMLNLLSDYKKQIVLTRLNFVLIKIYNHISLNGEDFIYYLYVTDDRFEKSDGKWTKNGPHWSVEYTCYDEWENWKQTTESYEDIFNYRNGLVDLFEKEFNEIIEVIENKLSLIKDTNECKVKDRVFSKRKYETSAFFDVLFAKREFDPNDNPILI